MLTCRLEFDCTNNTTEYEALVQGLYKAIKLNVKYLQVFRDSEIVVKQLKTTFRTKWGTYAYQKMPFDVEKHAYAVFKAIKYLRPFLLKTRTKIIVLFPAVRNLLVQKDLGEKRANWITALHEYDLEIKPANVVRGQGFCKMLAGASQISKNSSEEVQICEVSLNDAESLYANIIYFLKNGYAPSHLDHTKKRALRLKAKQYQLINDILFRKNYDYVLLRCLENTKAEKVLQELHDGPAGRHYAGDAIAYKILRARYYWPTLFKDSHSYVRKCQVCQTTTGRQKKLSLPLQPVNIEHHSLSGAWT
eukprot:PITA_29794